MSIAIHFKWWGCPPDAPKGGPKIELDQLDQLKRKPLETNGKMFGTLQTYTNGHCQTI